MPQSDTLNRRVRVAGRSNAQRDSLVAVIAAHESVVWKSPSLGEEFFIDGNAVLPTISFEIETELPPPYQWSWTISWDARVSGLSESRPRGTTLRTFSQSGSFSSEKKTWIANFDGKVLGGALAVTVKAGSRAFRRTVSILGSNPSETAVLLFLSGYVNTVGFDRILRKESRIRQFRNADGEPIVSFDGGYGMSQTTNPPPSYEQVWNWKENVQRGMQIFRGKQAESRVFLSGNRRSFTDEQLALETLSRWNGGAYHSWNAELTSWERKPKILCDTATGNIGWNTESESNIGKTESELRERDEDTYRRGNAGRSAINAWQYSGVCYADHFSRR